MPKTRRPRQLTFDFLNPSPKRKGPEPKITFPYQGKERTLLEIAELTGISRNKLYWRLVISKLPMEIALQPRNLPTTPKTGRKPHHQPSPSVVPSYLA